MTPIDENPARRAAQLREEIRRCVDLDRQWPVADFVGALQLKTVTATALKRYFESDGAATASWRDLMDLAIPDMPDPRPGYMVAPLLDLRCVGVKGFRMVVDRLTELDLGEDCGAYWRWKLAILRRSRRMKGPRPHSWSKPIEPSNTADGSRSRRPAATD